MGLMDLFRPPARASGRVEPPLAAAGPGAAVSSPSQWGGFVVGGVATRSRVRVDERTVLGLPATLQALRILSGVFAMTPLHLFRRGPDNGRTREDSALADLLHDRPNGYQSAFEYREMLMLDLMLDGDHIAYVHRDPAGIPQALTRLDPGPVRIAEYFDRREGRILFFDVSMPDSGRERLPARDIFHVRGFSRDGINGLTPLRYAREALGGAIATEQHAHGFWSSGGKVDTVLQAKGRISTEDKARIRRDFAQTYSGPNAERVAVLDQDLKAEMINPDLEKSQFTETRAFQVTELARIWGVPPHLIFDLSRATFGNIEQQSLEFVTYHLGPHFARVEQAATRQLAPPGLFFEHLTDALVRGDLKSRMEAYWLQRQMGMVNADELRRRDNLPAIGGAAGGEYWRPGNMGVAGAEPETGNQGTGPGEE